MTLHIETKSGQRAILSADLVILTCCYAGFRRVYVFCTKLPEAKKGSSANSCTFSCLPLHSLSQTRTDRTHMTNRTDVIIYSLLYIYGGRPLFFIMGNLFFVVKNANEYHITGIGISFI